MGEGGRVLALVTHGKLAQGIGEAVGSLFEPPLAAQSHTVLLKLVQKHHPEKMSFSQ